MKKSEILAIAYARLKENNIPDYEDSAKRLLVHALGIEYCDLYKLEIVKDSQVDDYLKLIDERCNHVPLDKIIGYKYFYTVKIPFNKNVLTPRYETELMVDRIVTDIRIIYAQAKLGMTINPLTVLDLCTGSGCVGLAIANTTGANVTLSDVDKDVLNIAMSNNELNNKIRESKGEPPINPNFVLSDMFENIKWKFNMIVCNPPYIKTKDLNKLEIEVRDFDPMLALDGGKDGLDFYRTIAKEAHKHLKDGGIMYLEVGYDQAQKVAKMLEKNYEVQIKKDLANIDRFIIAKKREKNAK